MTTPHEPTSVSDPGPDAALRRALDALPMERTPPADVWARLQQDMAQPTTHPAVPAANPPARAIRRHLTVAMLGVAALLTIVALPSRTRGRPERQGDTLERLLPEERRDPRVQAVMAETQHWRTASRDPLRSVRWPREAREAVEASLAATETALAAARLVLRENPGDAVAREAIDELRLTQLVLLQRAMSLLDDI